MVKEKNKNYSLYNISLVSGDTEINVVINAIVVTSYISLTINRGTKDQIPSISQTIEKEREFQKNIYFCSNDYTKAFDCVYHNKLWKILQEMGISDQLSCLLRNLYAGQEATVRTRHGAMDCFQIGKGVHQDCILSPCLFHLYADYIMQNTRVNEAKAGIKIVRRTINNFRYANDTTLRQKAKRKKRAS